MFNSLDGRVSLYLVYFLLTIFKTNRSREWPSLVNPVCLTELTCAS